MSKSFHKFQSVELFAAHISHDWNFLGDRHLRHEVWAG